MIGVILDLTHYYGKPFYRSLCLWNTPHPNSDWHTRWLNAQALASWSCLNNAACAVHANLFTLSVFLCVTVILALHQTNSYKKCSQIMFFFTELSVVVMQSGIYNLQYKSCSGLCCARERWSLKCECSLLGGITACALDDRNSKLHGIGWIELHSNMWEEITHFWLGEKKDSAIVFEAYFDVCLLHIFL